MKPFEYFNNHYGVNACVGRRVAAYGKPGTIVEDMGHYIGIVLDGGDPHNPRPYHPTDGIEYGEVVKWNPPKRSRSKRRYAAYLASECGEKFRDWLLSGYWDDYRRRNQC